MKGTDERRNGVFINQDSPIPWQLISREATLHILQLLIYIIKHEIQNLPNNLELIRKLAMNLDKLAPDNNGASKMDQSKVVLSFLFKANK